MSISIHNMVIVSFFVIFFSRVFSSIGLPSFVNFLHYPVVFVIAFFAIKSFYNHNLSKYLLGIIALIVVVVLSAILNNAGVVNVVLDLLMLLEPFVLLLIIVNIQWSEKSINTFRTTLLIFMLLHILMSYFQFFLLGSRHDDVKGVFLGMGAGAHVAGSVALIAAIYVISSKEISSLWVKVFFVITALGICIITDSKQVIAVFALSYLFLLLMNINNLKVLFHIAIRGILGIAGLFILFLFAPAFFVWVQPEPELLIEGFSQKLSVFGLISTQYEFLLQWLFGLGPGHTIGRLGLLIPSYFHVLEGMGVTISNVTDIVVYENQAHWTSNSITGSSMFSLTFSWAGLWGDLGLFGVLAYVYIWREVWLKLCDTNGQRYLVIVVFVFAGVFSWMEEPAFMAIIIIFIGLMWQEQKNRALNEEVELAANENTTGS